MNVEPRRPSRHGPPRGPATAGDTLFALGLAALGIALVGAFLAAGGSAWLDRYLPAADAGAAATPRPSPAASAASPIAPIATATPAPTPPPSPAPTPAASPAEAEPFTMDLYQDGVFVHELDDQSCVAAAVQGMLNVIRLTEDGQEPDTTDATQQALYARIVELTTAEDSHNGGTGPGGWAALLTEEGYPYEVRAFRYRAAAVNAAAAAIRATGRPVGMLTWKGVHSWVMTGFTATADPATRVRFTVDTAFVMDPWYPWVSTIWPRSKAPGEPHDAADLKANFLPFSLRSGPYPDRDGQFVLVVPLES